jgi:polar amino acid transport system ATP-binding protein
MNSCLRIENLSKAYGSVLALRDINLTLPQGKTYAVMGPNGSGKSTLLKCIVGLENTSGGSCFLNEQLYLRDGKPIVPWRKVRSQMVIVLQSNNLIPNMTVYKNLRFAFEHGRGLPRKQAEADADEICETFALTGFAHSYPNEISGGQAQRAAIGRAFGLHPNILLLDEVTSALDPIATAEIFDCLRKVSLRRAEVANLVITHSIKVALELSDMILFLSRGRILDRIPTCEWPSKNVSEEAREFFGIVERYFL